MLDMQRYDILPNHSEKSAYVVKGNPYCYRLIRQEVSRVVEWP